jgi:hypothetical protein
VQRVVFCLASRVSAWWSPWEVVDLKSVGDLFVLQQLEVNTSYVGVTGSITLAASRKTSEQMPACSH